MPSSGAFPDESGYRFFLIETAEGQDAAAVKATLARGLAGFGLSVETAADRLAAFSTVENTYLLTFQSLGALGLLLGTFGLAAVQMRSVLERRRELALMRATGFGRRKLGGTGDSGEYCAFGRRAGLRRPGRRGCGAAAPVRRRGLDPVGRPGRDARCRSSPWGSWRACRPCGWSFDLPLVASLRSE